MRLRSFLMASSIMAIPLLVTALPASAQPITGLYVGGGAGWNHQDSEGFRASSALGSPKLTGHFDDGFVGLGSIGYGLGNGLRVELEGNYRNNHISEFSGTPIPGSAGGVSQQYGVMVNALFDMDAGFDWMYPYVGVGAGYGWSNLDKANNRTFSTPLTLATNDTYGNFAYQGIVGASFPLAYAPGLSATLEYRYYGELGPQKYSATLSSPGGVISAGNFDTRGDIGNQSVLIGLRYAFNTNPPPPPPAPAPVSAPAPAPSRTYLVFFDWDRADLTDRARQIISEAATNSSRVQYTKLQVNGYTDLSGTAAYNQRLSVRRAQVVAAELVRDGVPRNVINIQGFGESNPLVPTAQGVREPQNRRVEIIIQ
jgi:OOP family OmpA-OmpF porin